MFPKLCTRNSKLQMRLSNRNLLLGLGTQFAAIWAFFIYMGMGPSTLSAASARQANKTLVTERQISCEPICYCFLLCRVYRLPVRPEV
jgi:hypothetical protein